MPHARNATLLADHVPPPVPGDCWRALVAEAALVAGLDGIPDSGGSSISLADPPPSSGSPDRTELSITGATPTSGPSRRAELVGALLADATVYSTSATADLQERTIRLTCQAGRFSVHDEALSRFEPSNVGISGSYNLARAGFVATLPRDARNGSTEGVVRATVCVPVAYDNTLQRVWRLAVPSREMLLDADDFPFAVAGLRGRITLAVLAGAEPAWVEWDFLDIARSAHRPNRPEGYGPRRGVHPLEVEARGLDAATPLTVAVDVSLLALVAGDPERYRPDAPLYAGVDFGGGGSARLPHQCLSAFEIPLTPLIGNDPISVPSVAFGGS